MNPFRKVWFWLLILSIIGFIITFIGYERFGQTNTGTSTTPWWIWIVFGLSFILWAVALILYIIDVAAYYRRMEIAEACGELPPPPPKKKIECPKKECKEKKIIECVEKVPCEKKQVVVNTEEPVVSTQTIVATQGNIPVQAVSPKVVTINAAPEEAFSAASLKPLSSLAPAPAVNINV